MFLRKITQYGMIPKFTDQCLFTRFCPNISTTPITAMGCQQCLPLSVVQLPCQLKGQHFRNGVVDTFALLNMKPPRIQLRRFCQFT